MLDRNVSSVMMLIFCLKAIIYLFSVCSVLAFFVLDKTSCLLQRYTMCDMYVIQMRLLLSLRCYVQFARYIASPTHT
jgi:hypothetical protein